MAGFPVPEGHRPGDIRPGAPGLSSELTETVFLGMGSNLGDRLGFLGRGLQVLAAGGLTIERLSSVMETPAIGHESQPPFLNLVVKAEWDGGPQELMALMRGVEEEAGRERSFPNSPRTLDVDLIFFGDRILRSPGIRVPHPRWKDRSFVVRPLQQLAPGLVDVETGFRVREIRRLWLQEPVEISEILGDGEFNWREMERE